MLVDPDGNRSAGVHVLCTQMPAEFDDVTEQMAPIVAQMHQDNGLIAALTHTHVATWYGKNVPDGWDSHLVPSEADVDDLLLSVIRWHVPDQDTVTLCGSGIGHFDVPFMEDNGWQLPGRCTWWHHDVGVVRRWLHQRGWSVSSPGSAGPDKAHRALDDVIAHFVEDRLLSGLLPVATPDA
jgi:oligoribonuclease (3'-5' exoribonuclease)